MNLGIISRLNFGYDDLEPVILGLMAMNKSFMLIGRHGTGKTRLARILSRGYGEGTFAFSDATKDDLISIAGIPDPEAIRNGSLRFVPQKRGIWDKSTIVVDEITRAGKDWPCRLPWVTRWLFDSVLGGLMPPPAIANRVSGAGLEREATDVLP